MASKMIGAIGSTYSVRKEGIDQRYQTESGHCCGDTHLDIYGCEAWTLQTRHKGHIHAGYADEGVYMDRRGVKIKMRKVSFRGILKQEEV